MHRFYHPNELTAETLISLSKDEAHHLKHVMRTDVGAPLEVVNGKGQLATGVYKGNNRVFLDTATFTKTSEPPCILLQAWADPKHLEWIVEKTTEIGIDEIWLFRGDKSSLKVLSEGKKERLAKITVSALKQSKRLYLPQLAYFSSLDKIPLPKNLYFGDLTEKNCQISPGEKAICIGPESGFSKREKELLLSKGAKGVALSKNVLRCETAAIVAAHTLCFSSCGENH